MSFDRKNGANLILPISVKSNIQKRPSASVPASFLIHSIGILKKQLMLHKWLFTTAAVWQKKMWAWFEFDWMLCGGVFVESKNDAHYASTSAKVLRSSVQTVWIGLGNRYVNQTLKNKLHAFLWMFGNLANKYLQPFNYSIHLKFGVNDLHSGSYISSLVLLLNKVASFFCWNIWKILPFFTKASFLFLLSLCQIPD